MIPMDRVMERLDRYFESNDTAGAKRHLEYWIAEAKQTGDTRSLITLYNEKMGLHRRCGEGDDAIACAKAALAAAEREGISGTVSEGTVMINCATVYTAFGKVDDALPLFAKAADIYESNLGGADPPPRGSGACTTIWPRHLPTRKSTCGQRKPTSGRSR